MDGHVRRSGAVHGWSGEIYIDEKPGGYDFAGEHPRLTGEEFMQSIGLGGD